MHRAALSAGHDFGDRANRAKQRVAVGRGRGDYAEVERAGVGADEPVPPAVERHAVLAVPADRLQPRLGEVQAEVAAADRYRLRIGKPNVGHGDGAQSVGEVQPAVRADRGMVRSQLLVVLGQSGQPGFGCVGAAVAVGVAKEQQLAGHGDEATVAVGLHAGRHQQTFGKDDRRLEPAVAVLVGQNADATVRRVAVLRAERVVAHFHDPQPPALVEADRDRVDHVRLAGDQFGRQSVRQRQRRRLAPLGRGGAVRRLGGGDSDKKKPRNSTRRPGSRHAASLRRGRGGFDTERPSAGSLVSRGGLSRVHPRRGGPRCRGAFRAAVRRRGRCRASARQTAAPAPGRRPAGLEARRCSSGRTCPA